MKVYLAGAMEKKQNKGKQWRVHFGEKLTEMGWEVFDPVKEEDSALLNCTELQGRDIADITKQDIDYELVADKIWQRDMELIRKSDLMIVYLDEQVFASSGTLCEMSHAKDLELPMCILRKVPIDDIPLWTRACFKGNFVTTNITELLSYVADWQTTK